MMFVGGFKHMPNLDGMKWFCKEVMPAVVKKLPHVTLDIYGSHIPDEIMKLRGPNVRIMGFLHDKDLARVYGGHRLVVSPLRYGAGMKGKNVEAMYNGVPLITTSIGAEGINCASVIIADEALSFAEKIIENYNSPDLADISRKLREYVRDNFSERVLDKSFSGVLPAAAGARPAARKKDIAGARR